MDSLIRDKINFLHGLLSLSVKPASVINNNLLLNLPTAQIPLIKVKLDEWNISYENIVDSEILVHLSSIDLHTIVFFSEMNFRQGVEKVLGADGNIIRNVALIDYKGSFLIYEHQTGKAYLNSQIVTSDFLIENTTCYYKVLSILKGDEFADYVNTIDKEIVLYSGMKGIKRIQIPDYLPQFDSSGSIRQACNSLVSKLGSSDFKIYFKNQLFDFRGSGNVTALQEIILSLGNIIHEADNNLQLYLKNFSFEKLKNDLQREKEKYFSSLREILGKNLSQIVSIPVSFAASVFATYRVSDVFVLSIILLAFILYSIFTYYLQSLYLTDIKEIAGSFKKDFSFISEKSGLPANDIDSEKIKIERRINDIRNVIVRFRYLLLTLTIVFTIFIFYQVLKLV